MEFKPTKETFRSYLFFWSGQLFSLFGSTVINFLLIWWLTTITGSAVIVSIAYFANFVPFVVLIPLAGVFADRFKKKSIILIADSTQAFLTFLLVISFLVNIENIWLVIGVNGVRGIAQAFHQPTTNAVIPSMVPKEKLSRINGINFLFAGVVQISGNVVAGILWAIFGIENLALMLMIDVFTFFIALIPLLIISIPSINIDDVKKKITILSDFLEGLNIMRKLPGVIILIGLSMLLNFLIQPINTLLTIFIQNVHGGGPEQGAIISAMVQGGMIIGAFIVSAKKEWTNKMRWIFIGLIGIMVGYGFTAMAPTGWIFWIGISGASFAFFLPLVNSLYNTVIQTIVPHDKIGRIMSIDMTLSMLISPVGILISGPLGEFFGVANLFLYCAIIGLGISVITWFFSGIKHIDYDALDSLEGPKQESGPLPIQE
jgi:DHA3 family macrolide efflux protein-like MFS transporter